MSCLVTLKGIGQDCLTNLSGIKTVYIANYADVSTLTVDASTNTINNIEMNAEAKFHTYVFPKNTGSLTKTLTKSESTGVLYYTNELAMQFNRMETQKRLEINALAAGQLAVIVQDMNGIYWYLGKDNYVSGSAATGQTGSGMDDGNFYTITLQDISAELPYAVDSSVIAGIIE